VGRVSGKRWKLGSKSANRRDRIVGATAAYAIPGHADGVKRA